MVSLREMLEKVLKDLKAAGDVEASAIVSRDGLLIASDIPQSVNAEAFANLGLVLLEMGKASEKVKELLK